MFKRKIYKLTSKFKVTKKSKIKVIYLITIKVSPMLTASPGSTKISSTVPSTSAWISFSIFIASITAMVDPCETLSPTLTLSLITIPCIGEGTAPSTGLKFPDSVSSISMNPVGMILTSNTSPSTSTLYWVGIPIPSFSSMVCAGLSSSSSASPLRNFGAIGGYNA